MAQDDGHAPVDPAATAGLDPQEIFDPPISNWDRYEITALLGTGGMAQVFKAFDQQLKRHVALKFIRGEDSTLRERLLKEARAQAQIEHPHICKIYEAGEVQNRYFIAMQWIQGHTLAQLQPELLLEQKVKIMQQVADAVQSAHRLGIIHRDLKPTNIMVENTPDGALHPYVMDFGIAREIGSPSNTATDQVLGTPSFMSPEQIFGDRSQLDRRTDVYCLGSTFYFLLSGRAPFEGTALEVLVKITRDTPERLRDLVPGIPPDIETIVSKCLEKEQVRRYDSAKALSDDLKRYLNGEPIQARPPSLVYRMAKRIKKNKLLALSILILLIAAGFGIYTRWRTAQQLRLSQEFMQSIESMDWMMRVAHMSPLHDIRKEKKQILERMRILEANMKRSGSQALGPGHYALGKGFLALQDYEKANKHLQEAWRNQYRTPETAFALSETTGALYQMELQRAEKIGTVLLRQQRKKEIEKKFRGPVLEYLKASKGVHAQAPEYLEALIDLYDKKYDSALQKSRMAFQRIPWFYEAKILEGRIYQIQGSEKLDKGDPAKGENDLHLSEIAYQTALKIGQSDPQLHRGLCVLRNEMFYAAYYGEGTNLESLKSKAMDACSLALAVDADDPVMYNTISYLHCSWAEHEMENGKDSSGSVQKALDSAERAIQLDPQGAEGYQNAGMALRQRARSESITGKDAVPAFQLSVSRLKHAVELDQNNASTLNYLGLTYMDLGDFQMYHGKDPRLSYEEATKNFRKTLQNSPDYFAGYVNLGILYSAIGEYEMDHGHDPVASLKQAIEILDKGREINPSNIYCYRWLLYVHRDIGEHQYHLGQDPTEEFQAAEKFFEMGKRLKSEDAFLYSEISTVPLMRAEIELEKGKSPMTHIQSAREILATALRLNPSDTSAQSRIGYAHLLEARWNLLQGKNPEGSLNQSRSAFQQSIKMNPNEAGAYIGLAEHYYWIATFRKSEEPVQEGLKTVEQALRVNPASAEAYGCKGMLLSLKDRSAAEEAFRQAFSRNRHLTNRYRRWRS